MEGGKPFMSIPMEVEELSDIDLDTIDEESISERSQFSTGSSLDEFELVVKTLKGNPITKEKETQVGYIILIS